MPDEKMTFLISHNNWQWYFYIQLITAFNQTMLIVTYDPDLANRTHRIIELEDGKLI